MSGARLAGVRPEQAQALVGRRPGLLVVTFDVVGLGGVYECPKGMSPQAFTGPLPPLSNHVRCSTARATRRAAAARGPSARRSTASVSRPGSSATPTSASVTAVRTGAPGGGWQSGGGPATGRWGQPPGVARLWELFIQAGSPREMEGDVQQGVLPLSNRSPVQHHAVRGAHPRDRSRRVRPPDSLPASPPMAPSSSLPW